MSQQVVYPYEVPDVTQCKRCGFHKKVELFQLCTHGLSAYTNGVPGEFHSCQHMRRDGGQCGPELRLAKWVR